MLIYLIIFFAVLVISAIFLIIKGREIDDKALKRWGAINGTLATLIALFALINDVIPNMIKELAVTPTPTVTVTSAPLLIPTAVPISTTTPTTAPIPTLTLVPSLTPKPACFCQSTTDDLTARCLIDAESAAANKCDQDSISQIFSPYATIYQGDTRTTWHSPKVYYQESFQKLKFSEAKHFDITLVKIVGDALYYTSGSSGNYTLISTGEQKTYTNENPSEHWVFQKNQDGCWVVTSYDFNDSHDLFP